MSNESETNKLSIVDQSGNVVEDIDLDSRWVERLKGNQAVRDSVVTFLASKRGGTASTKNRSEVRGGSAKPWRQKGTGRARAGNVRSPLWKGGGVTFGPCPRDFSKKLNSKARKLALKRSFTARLDDGDIIAINDFNISEPKTKLMVDLLTRIKAGTDTLIVIMAQSETNVIMSGRNLNKTTVLTANTVNAYHLLAHKKIIFTKQSLELFGSRLS